MSKMATTPTNNKLSALIATLTSQVAALTSAVSPPGTTSAAFTLSPGRASPEDLIDYTTKLGGSLWSQSTKSLDTPYDMTSKHTVVFIKALANHAKVHHNANQPGGRTHQRREPTRNNTSSIHTLPRQGQPRRPDRLHHKAQREHVESIHEVLGHAL